MEKSEMKINVARKASKRGKQKSKHESLDCFNMKLRKENDLCCIPTPSLKLRVMRKNSGRERYFKLLL